MDITLQTIKDKESEFTDLFTRMDGDEDLYHLVPYVMKDPNGKDTPDVINVTFNDPKVFVDRAIALKMGALMQPVVEGRGMKDKETTLIEQFLTDMFISVDDYLFQSRGWSGQFPFHCEKIDIRGHIGARVLLREDVGLFIPDVLPIDMRHCTYERGIDGLLWCAPNYIRSKAMIKSEYDIDISAKTGLVRDLWTREDEVVWVDGKEVKNDKHNLGYVPFVIAQAPGSTLQGTDSIKHSGESILAPNRGLYPELNRTASILQTLNMSSFAGGLQYASEAGVEAEKPDLPPFGLKTVLPVEKDGGYKPMPINDIKAATRLFYAILDARLQRASFSSVDYGNLTFPLSAVAISRLTAHKNEILLPRIQALAMLYQQMAKMIIRQYQEGGIKAELGAVGYKRLYESGALKGDFNINYRFVIQSPDEDIANLSIANSAVNILSPDTVRRKYLKVEDPEGEEMKYLAAIAERADPAIAFYRRCVSLIKEDKDTEARIMKNRLITHLKQRAMAEAPNMPLVGGKGGGEAEMPLTERPGLGTGGKRQTLSNESPEFKGMERDEEETERETAVAESRQEGRS